MYISSSTGHERPRVVRERVGERERERESVDKYVRIIQRVIGSTGPDPKNKNYEADSFAIRISVERPPTLSS